MYLRYVMRNKDTPRKDKRAIFGSLACLILPIGILDSKRLPVIGRLDEVVSPAVLVQKMSKYITPKMEASADSPKVKVETQFSTCPAPYFLRPQGCNGYRRG